MNNCFRAMLFLVITFSSSMLYASNTIVSSNILSSTENGLFMDNGRYFVAGNDGIHEVKITPDYSSNCTYDFSSGYTVCEIVSTSFDGEQCMFTGMTTDDTYLYAACTIGEGGLLGALIPPTRSVLFRVLPGSGSFAQEIKTQDFDVAALYNGMAMLDNDTLLITPSNFLTTSAAITKVDITNTNTFEIQESEYLDNSIFYLIPNGIAVDNGYIYMVGGQNLYRIRIRFDGSPGVPTLIFQTTVNQLLDDFVISGNWIIVSNVSALNGLGINNLTILHKTGLVPPSFISTGFTQTSSIAIDPGTFYNPGSLITTSFFQGGVQQY